MKNLIILFVLSLFAFTNNANAYAIIDAAPPVEKTTKKKKHRKKGLFKKRSKQVKQTKMKESVLYLILALIFTVSSIAQVIIGLAFGFTTIGIVLLVITLLLALLFAIFVLVAQSKESEK